MISKMKNNRTTIAASIRVLSRWPVRFMSATVDAGPVTYAVSPDPATVCLIRLSTRVNACLDCREPRSPGKAIGNSQAL